MTSDVIPKNNAIAPRFRKHNSRGFAIYSSWNDDESITVGNISASESLSAKLDLNKLVSRHCAIVGSTGSGKSNTVAILLEAIAKRVFFLYPDY